MYFIYLEIYVNFEMVFLHYEGDIVQKSICFEVYKFFWSLSYS